ncbi:LysR family transcriptional regulator [Cryptosporangium sp. NPDC051539]|uniref:LysR family transcriptional regulator n=1 Tax=Cryptosporangium sp. NPDC051539 TaxID=3363962 RepID=UPI003793B87A
MELRQLRHLVGVADARSFTVAAVRLGISQPALSQSIARLEQHLDCLLFVRNKQNPGAGLLLTPAGTTLYADARGILDAVDRAASRAQRAGQSLIALGFSSSTPRALTRAAVGIAGAEMVPVQLDWGDDHASLSSGRVDLAFLQYRVGSVFPAYVVAGMVRAPLVALFASGHALARRASVTLDDLAEEPILDPGEGEVDRDFWLGEPRPHGRGYRVVGPAVRTVEEMCAFVAAGKGMAITSGFVAEQYRQPDLAFVPVEGLEPVEVGLVRLRDDERRPVVAVFDELARLSSL